jgi:hypothetical protein
MRLLISTDQGFAHMTDAQLVRDLVNAIRTFIDAWNDRCEPFVWTKTADELLDHARPGQRTSFTRH